MPRTRLVSIVIPAFNEEKSIGYTLDLIPHAALKQAGWEIETIVVDNNSQDRTGEIARSKGARVIFEPIAGYGRAYKAGLSAATGEVFCTGDADGTYPFGMLPELLKIMDDEHLDFLATNRFVDLDPRSMKTLNLIGNTLLSIATRLLYGMPLRDSQSGMWVCRADLWKRMRVLSDGMPFSQEFKIDAIYYARAQWREVPIRYGARLGVAKLNAWRDGMRNLIGLLTKRIKR